MIFRSILGKLSFPELENPIIALVRRMYLCELNPSPIFCCMAMGYPISQERTISDSCNTLSSVVGMRICLWALMAMVFLSANTKLVFATAVQASDASTNVELANVEEAPSAHLIKVGLPIDGRSASHVKLGLEKIVDEISDDVAANIRPIVVLEFDTSRGANGKGSSLGACIDLARFISGPELSRLKTVAFLPNRNTGGDANSELNSKLIGHAVLVALSADQIALSPNVKIGSAGVDETTIDAFVLEAYKNIVSKRLRVPAELAMAMIDKSMTLHRVRTKEGPKYVDDQGLKNIEDARESEGSDTLATSRQFAELSAKQFVEFGLVRQETKSRADLARQLNISADSLKSELINDKPWKALRVEFPDYIDKTTVEWVTRSLEPKIAQENANLIIFDFDSSNGDIDSCLRLARRLSSYDPEEVQTVAFINNKASGPAAFLALSCYHVVMKTDGTIGGDFQPRIAESKLGDLKDAAAGVAEIVGRDPAIFQATLDPDMEIVRFRNKQTGGERLFTQKQRDQFADAENWLPQGAQDVFEPISSDVALKQEIARQTVASFDEFKSFYQLDDEPELLKPTSVDRWLHQTANFLASPFVAPWLLFLAMFFLFNEISQPGLGVPGFLGTVCLILYFWSQHLDGNANWLEILLFAAGILFLAIELFVVPGFGVFGVGGLLMVVISIVLASQTFILPTTNDEFNQLPKSLFALAGAFGGLVFAMVALRTILPNTPIFKKIMLDPPAQAEGFGESVDRESMVNWQHLVGRRGLTVTTLGPAGKAKIDGQLFDVISDGRLIEKDQEVVVFEVAGNRVVVKILDAK